MMKKTDRPKYRALYKVFDPSQPFRRGKPQVMGGDNKEELKQRLKDITQCGTPHVWAIITRDGWCVDGGTTGSKPGNSQLWGKDYRNDIARRFFGKAALKPI